MPELGTLDAELGALMAAGATVVWVPTGAVLRDPAPAAALKDPAPTAELNPYITSVTLGGSE